jgi:uncharacterized protein
MVTTRAQQHLQELPPGSIGIGLRSQHHAEVLTTCPSIGWLEAHTENYLSDGGFHIDALMRIRERYPVALHGVGLSLGSSDPLDLEHLAKVAAAIRRFEPIFVSEHLSWSSVEGRFANDLLPLPYTEECVDHVVRRIIQVQVSLDRQVLIENVSSYLQLQPSCMPEWQFINAVAAESGCGVLLDLNNIYVSACNHGFDPHEYLRSINPSCVRELHLAGHTAVQIEGRPLLIDTHGAPVCAEVWDLFRSALSHLGEIPTIIEWDTDIPALSTLLEEAHKADLITRSANVRAA